MLSPWYSDLCDLSVPVLTQEYLACVHISWELAHYDDLDKVFTYMKKFLCMGVLPACVFAAHTCSTYTGQKKVCCRILFKVSYILFMFWNIRLTM